MGRILIIIFPRVARFVTGARLFSYIKAMMTYREVTERISDIGRRGAETGSIGRSEYGSEIPFIKIGRGKPTIIVTAAIHARENVTASLALDMAEYARESAADGSLYFLPMLNPDGARLIEEGAAAFGQKSAEFLLRVNGGDRDFSLWKANGQAVDLNVNFAARWGEGSLNRFVPSPESYVGKQPFSAAETRALRDFTLSAKPDCTLSLHAKGRVVYWYFHQSGEVKARDRRIAEFIASETGYALGEAYTTSAGGYKDWCVEKLGIPAFTIEVVSDYLRHPLPDDALAASEKAALVPLPVRLLREL